MRLAKAAGLALVAALAMAAFGGASTASATVLCKVHPEKVVQEPEGETVDVCPEASVYGDDAGESAIQANLQSKTSDFVTQDQAQEEIVVCENAEMSGTITQAQQVEGQLERAVFEGKQTEPDAEQCEEVKNGLQVFVTVENLPYDVEAEYTGQQEAQDKTEEVGAGKVKANGKPGEPIKFMFEAQEFPFTTCVYEAKNENPEFDGKVINGSVEDQRSQVIFDKEQTTEFTLQEGDFGCEDEGKLKATFDLKGEQNGEEVDIYIAKEKA